MRLSVALAAACMIVGCEARAKPALAPTPEALAGKAAVKFAVKIKPRRCYAGAGTERFREHTSTRADYSLTGAGRMKLARTNKLAVVKKMLSDSGLNWPPKQVFLRAFKEENVLELWASNNKKGALKHVASYQICFASGTVGPKRREGDGQVPEGFYKLDYYNRKSSYFLSMRINYPNLRDRRLKRTGSSIMIHGNCVSIGCLAMSDERIEELWLLTRAAHTGGSPVHVHLFPSCDLRQKISETNIPRLKTFWRSLKKGYDLFQKDHKVPRIGVNRKGDYTFPE